MLWRVFSKSRVSDALGTCTALLCLSTLGGVVTLKSELPSKHCSLGEASRMAATRGATFHDPLRDTPPSEWTDIEICAVECEAVPHDFRKLAVHLIFVLFFPLVYHCTVPGAWSHRFWCSSWRWVFVVAEKKRKEGLERK
jgi:hypothetical protein